MAKKQESGSARMMRLGKKPILIWPTEAEKEIIDLAAKSDSRSTAAFCLFSVLLAAKKKVGK